MRYCITIILFVSFISCIKQVTPDVRQPLPSLVVEGLLLTDTTPCKVTLSYSGTVNHTGFQDQQFINDAIVYLHNTTGDSIPLRFQKDGLYIQSDAFIISIGSAYFISIHLADGSLYQSTPEIIQPVTNFGIDTIDLNVPVNFPDIYGAEVKIKTHDPANETNFYRWITYSIIPREATGVPCGFGCIMDQFCYQYFQDPDVTILSDANINGNDIKNQTVLISPYFSFGRHYIEIKQLSITKNAYQFWQLYNEQTLRTGSILDPLPSSLQGNIYCVTDPTKIALGYFEASAVYAKKIIISPTFNNTVYAFHNKGNYIKQGACYLVLPNAQRLKPQGFEDAPEFKINVF